MTLLPTAAGVYDAGRSPVQTWWSDAFDREPLRWDDARAYFVDVNESIRPDTQVAVPDSRWSNLRWHHFRWLERETRCLPDGTRLLDLGCGQMQFGRLYTRFDVCGVDHYPYPATKIVTDFHRGLPLRERCADVVVLSNVLEHIFYPALLLTEVTRVLRPGGELFIVVPFMIKIHQAPHDYHRYTNFALQQMVADAGMRIVRMDTLGNVFDIHDVDRWARANLIRAHTKGWRRFAARALIKIQNLSEKGLGVVVPATLRQGADTIGFPQSYGIRAQKPT